MIFVGKGVFCQQYNQFHQALIDNKRSFYDTRWDVKIQRPSTILPADFYCTQLGFFCKKELKLEATTKIPFRFRIGSLPYNDWLEGKKNAGILPANRF